MSGTRSTARNSALVTMGSVTNVVLGLLFQLLLAHQLGLSASVDIYTLGTMTPTFLATILIGSAPSVLVPAFTRISRQRDDALIPVRLASAPTIAVIGLTVLAGLLTALATPLLAGNLPSGSESALISFIVITSVSIPLAWGAAVSQAVLIVKERFLVVGLAGATNGLGLLVAAVLVFAFGQPIPGLAVAFVAGYVAQIAAQAIAAFKHTTFEPVPPSGAIMSALAVLLGSALIYKSQPIIERVLAAAVENGPAALNYSSKIAQALLMASSLGLALVSLPTISRHVSDDDYPKAFRTASGISLAICCISAPLVVTSIVAAENVVGLLYGRGAFTESAILLVALALAAAAVGVLFSAMTGPIVNLLYATSRYRFVATISITTTILGAATSWLLREPLGLPGIVLGSTAAFTANFAIYWFAAARHHDLRQARLILRPLILVILVGGVGALLGLVPLTTSLPAPLDDVVRLGLIGVPSAALSAVLYLALRERTRDLTTTETNRGPRTK